jgi:hypothetical protein
MWVRHIKVILRFVSLVPVCILLCLFASAALGAIKSGVQSLGSPKMVVVSVVDKSTPAESVSPPVAALPAPSTTPRDAGVAERGTPPAQGNTPPAADGSTAPVVLPYIVSIAGALSGVLIMTLALVTLLRDE